LFFAPLLGYSSRDGHGSQMRAPLSGFSCDLLKKLAKNVKRRPGKQSHADGIARPGVQRDFLAGRSIDHRQDHDPREKGLVLEAGDYDPLHTPPQAFNGTQEELVSQGAKGRSRAGPLLEDPPNRGRLAKTASHRKESLPVGFPQKQQVLAVLCFIDHDAANGDEHQLVWGDLLSFHPFSFSSQRLFLSMGFSPP
jgi:hypothetical protein